MIFIVSLAIFIIILTIFENVFLAIFAWICLSTIVIIYSWIKKDNSQILKNIWIIALALVISIISVFVKNYTYNKKIETLSTSTWLIYNDMSGPQWNYFIWTWIISDIYSYQKYVFQDNDKREYFLKSTSKYEIWDVIRLNWYVNLWYTWWNNIFQLKNQRKNLWSHIDISSIFQYDFDYPKWEMMKWFYGTIYKQNSIILDNSGTNISRTQKIRKSLQHSIVSAYWETRHAWLVLWMLIWDRSQITNDDYQWFIDSWLVHIIAVSGWNIVMIVVFLSAILFFLPFYTRNAVILLTIIWYAMICWLDSSVFRATIMGGLSLLALFRWREINIRRAMWTAFVVMLIVNPYFLAYDVWFLLSFSAIIWIIFFSKFMENHQFKFDKKDKNTIKNQWKQIFQKILKEYITPTIWATLWVLPIMLFFMWWANLLSIIANFFVTPIIAIVMIYGFISTILFGIIPRNLRLRPEKLLIDYIYFISDLTVKFGVYLQATWNRIKWILLSLFIIRLLIKTIHPKEKHSLW